MTTTPTSGAADLLDLIEAYAEARHRQGHSSYNAQTAAALQAVKDALAAGQATAAQPAAQQGAAYAALPEPDIAVGNDGRARIYTCKDIVGEPYYTAGQLRDFADATCAMRASHGQAPAQPATVHCKGRNCAAVDGDGHSDECASDHERAASGLDTAGNRNPVARYDGYRGAPCNPTYTKDQQAAWLEGYEARNRQGITPSPQADSAQEDAACWHWLAEYLVGPRTDLDDEIVASATVNDLRKLVESAIKQGATK